VSCVDLQAAVATIPPGDWAVGVSGGADSVALLRLAHERQDLRLTVVHLDHETRSGESAADAAFVAELADRLGLPAVIARRSDIEPRLANPLRNRSALFRACRMHLFRQVVQGRKLAGVLLAHHADDQAETIMLRLLRGSGPMGLGGMRAVSSVSGVCIRRPLLRVDRASLRAYLSEIGQDWREDASNQSPAYARNRVRRMLADHPALRDRLIEMATAMQGLRRWLSSLSPVLPEEFDIAAVRGLPSMVVEHSLRRWLGEIGVPPSAIGPAVVARVREMIEDAAAPPRMHLPGKIEIYRRRGRIGRSHG